MSAIDVVDLARTVEPDTGLEHGGRDGVGLDRGSRMTCEAIVWSSLIRKRFGFYLVTSHMHTHALDKILGMERNLWIGSYYSCVQWEFPDDLYPKLQ